MALFKIFKGPEEGLQDVPCHNGYAYFTEDLGNLYIDIGNGDPSTDRIQVNAYFAEELRNIKSDGTVEYISFNDIALKSAVQDIAHGGTGRQTLTPNALLIGDGANALKMVSIGENQVLVGDATSGVKGIDGNGAFYRLLNGVPQFGTLPIEAGGTNATTAAGARTNLDVYNKKEVDDKVDEVTTVAYTTTLTVDGWLAQGDKFEYTYANTDLKCGKSGDVPPTITYTSNLDEYSKIDKAEATVGVGIVFTTSKKPEANIGIIIIDNK